MKINQDHSSNLQGTVAHYFHGRLGQSPSASILQASSHTQKPWEFKPMSGYSDPDLHQVSAPATIGCNASHHSLDR